MMFSAWGLWAMSTVALALAVNVLWPVRAPGRAAAVSFFAGWLAGELAMHVLAALTVVTTVFVWAGALGAWPGVVGLTTAALAGVLLLAGQSQAVRTRVVVESALRDTLGPVSGPAPRSLLDPVRLAFPFPVRQKGVVCESSIEFCRYGSQSLRLDVHRARGHVGRGPTLVYVHGGGWVLGHRERQGLPLMQHMAGQGWVCVSVDYRLSPRATFPDHLVDVKRALVWVREHCDRLGADPRFVAIAGSSAGAHLAALAALTANDSEYQPGFEKGDTSVDACVGFYGIYDLLDSGGHCKNRGLQRLLEKQVLKRLRAEAPEVFRAASPIARVHPGTPAFLLLHGTKDTLVPAQQSREFFEALRATSLSPASYIELPGAQHAFEIFPSVRSAYAIAGVSRFLVASFARKTEKGAP